MDKFRTNLYRNFCYGLGTRYPKNNFRKTKKVTLMPSSPSYKRSYPQEYKTAKKRGEVSSGPSGDNAKRKAARRKLEKTGVKVKGKEVDHKNGNPKDNSRKNLRVTSKKTNRSFPRNSKAGKK